MAKSGKVGQKPRGRVALTVRRERVASLLARGFSQRQVAVALGIPASTVGEDALVVKREFRKALERSAEDIYSDATAELSEVRRELWLDFQRLANDPDRIGLRSQLLNLIAGLPERQARLGQSLGLVVEVPQRVEIVERLTRDLADVIMADPEAERVVARVLADVRP